MKLNRKIKDRLRLISLLRRNISLEEIKKVLNQNLINEILEKISNGD